MIVKFKDDRVSEVPGVHLGEEWTWVDHVHRAQVVERIPNPTSEGFAHTYWCGNVLERNPSGTEEAQPFWSRWTVVWLYLEDGGRIEQLCLGQGSECYLLNGDGKTIDRLM